MTTSRIAAAPIFIIIFAFVDYNTIRICDCQVINQSNATTTIPHHLPSSTTSAVVAAAAAAATSGNRFETGTEDNSVDETDIDAIPLNDREIADRILRVYRFPDASTNVSVAVHVVVDRILTQNEFECIMQVTIRQKWVEMRLAYEKDRTSEVPVILRSSAYIWNPNLVISNAFQTTSIGRDQTRIFKNGLVEFVQRMVITTTDNQSLRTFPFEKRNCTLEFANEDSRAKWTRITSIMVPKPGWGVWTLLDWHRNGKTVQLELKRSANIWMWTLYLPTMFLLLCSWISLWMNTKSQLSRTLLNSTAFLTILIVVICNSWGLPRTPYLKAVDVWSLMITIFAFLVILHSAMVTSSALKERDQRMKTFYGDEFDEKTRWLNETPYYAQLPEEQPKTAAKICDYVFRILFPISFLATSTVYFLHFLKPYFT